MKNYGFMKLWMENSYFLQHIDELLRLVQWRNQIQEIKGLEFLVNLQKLDLYRNQIKEIKGLESLVNLQELDLSDNQIQEIKDLELNVNLQKLDLSWNQIQEIKGLNINLQELYLSNNQIQEIKGLESLFPKKLFKEAKRRFASFKKPTVQRWYAIFTVKGGKNLPTMSVFGWGQCRDVQQ